MESPRPEFTVSEIHVEIKDGLPSSIQYELEDNQEDYCYLRHEDWCDLLSTIEVKDNIKREATQIKKIASTRAASLSGSITSVRITRNKKSRIGAGVLHSNKGSHNKAPKHHGTQSHCMIYKGSGITERKYMLHSAEDYFGNRTNQKTIKDGLVGPTRSRAEAVNQYKKSESKRRKELKALNNQNKIIFSITKKSGSRSERKKIKKIREKASKKR